MQTTEFIQMAMETSKMFVLGLIDDMKDAPLTQPTANGGNHPLWILGHLVYAEANIINHFILNKENPLVEWKEIFGQGSQPTPDASLYPALEELMQKWETVRAQSLKVLEGMTNEDLDKAAYNIPEEREMMFGTIGKCFMVAALHPAMHYGQVADARRTLGRVPAFA